MSRAAQIGWAAALASLAESAPKIWEQYEIGKKEKQEEGYKATGQKILSDYDAGAEDRQNAEEVSTYREMEKQGLVGKAAPAVSQISGEEPLPMYGPQDNPAKEVSPQKMAWKRAMSKVESGNDYGAVGPEIDKYKGKRGYRALGKYQIVPAFHFEKIGLDPNNPKDITHFLNTPQLQDHLYEKVTDEYWTGDPRTSTAKYYGSGSDKPVNTVEGGKAMPTGKEHWDKVAAEMAKLGADTSSSEGPVKKTYSLASTEPSGKGYEALKKMVEDKPQLPKDIKSKTLGKLKNFYENASPEVIKAMKPTLDALKEISNTELAEGEKKWRDYNAKADRWARAVVSAATLEAGLTKSDLAADKAGKAEDIQKLKLMQSHLEKQISDYRNIAKEYTRAGSSRKKEMQKQYPDLFKQDDLSFWETLGFGEPDQVIDAFHIQRLQTQLNQINDLLANSIGISSSQDLGVPSTGGAQNPIGGQGNLSKYITKAQ